MLFLLLESLVLLLFSLVLLLFSRIIRTLFARANKIRTKLARVQVLFELVQKTKEFKQDSNKNQLAVNLKNLAIFYIVDLLERFN